jgi:hypothetical protein
MELIGSIGCHHHITSHHTGISTIPRQRLQGGDDLLIFSQAKEGVGFSLGNRKGRGTSVTPP